MAKKKRKKEAGSQTERQPLEPHELAGRMNNEQMGQMLDQLMEAARKRREAAAPASPSTNPISRAAQNGGACLSPEDFPSMPELRQHDPNIRREKR